ncbi:DUF1493 family protein [Komagataeibacter saccharivorans]|uniref:DUF1493 family protein n=1 Tax=Komagataeibacter saccharivorans TaxID=265959 RepID=UPI0039E92418
MHILSEKFKNLLITEEKISENEMQLSTRIVEDLGIDGIEAHYFMVSYFDTFPIDEGDFDFHIYFNDETPVLLIIPAILFVFFSISDLATFAGQTSPQTDNSTSHISHAPTSNRRWCLELRTH